MTVVEGNYATNLPHELLTFPSMSIYQQSQLVITKGARKKRHQQKGTGKKGTSEKLGEMGTKEKKLFLFVDYFYYYLINIWTIQCLFFVAVCCSICF